MTVAIRDDASQAANSKTYSLNTPLDIQSGDLLVLGISFTGTSVTDPTTGISGGAWTKLGADIVNSAQTVRMYSRVATTLDAGAVISATATTTSHFVMGLIAYSGAAGVGQINNNIDGSSGTSHTTTAIASMASASSWGVCMFFEKSTSNPSWAVPAGMTQRVNQLITGAGETSMCAADTNGGVSTLAAKTATSGTSSKAVNVALEILASAAAVAPGAATGLSVVAGDSSATLSFTPGTTGGAPVTYTGHSTPASSTPSNTDGSPLVFTGMTNGTSYTALVTSSNTAGSTNSSASGSFTPNPPPAGVISRLASSSIATNAASSSLPIPATTQVGDFMLLFVAAAGSSPLDVVTVSSGWTQVGVEFANGTVSFQRIYSKRAVLSDLGGGVTVGILPTDKYEVTIAVYRGVAGIGEIEANEESSAGTSHVTTALTTMAAAGSWALVGYSEKSTTNTSWTPPAGMTTVQNELGTGAGAVSFLLADTNGIVTSLAAKTAVSGISTKAINFAVELLAGSAIVAPSAPTIGTVVASDGAATVPFTPGSSGGDPNVHYTAISNPGGFSAQSTSSPIVVNGLTDGTSYTFTVKATNSVGNATSGVSNPVTPAVQAFPFTVGVLPFTANAIGPPPPPSNTTILGVAAQDTQSGWDSIGSVAGVPLLRCYFSGEGPTGGFRSTSIGKITGPSKYILSYKPGIAAFMTGTSDAAATAWIKSMADGTFATAWHEPEQKAKQASGTNIGSWGPFITRWINICRAANPKVSPGMIYMSYTSNRRPVDSSGHTTFGANEWLADAAAAGANPDWIGFDCYPPDPTNLETEATGPVALANALFPGVPIIIPELGHHPTSARPDLLVQDAQYANDNNFPVVSYWDEDNTGVSGGGNFVLTTSELQIWGSLQ